MLDTAIQFHYDAKDSANGKSTKSTRGDIGEDSILKTSTAQATGQAQWHA